jgi:hypothetical protein
LAFENKLSWVSAKLSGEGIRGTYSPTETQKDSGFPGFFPGSTSVTGIPGYLDETVLSMKSLPKFYGVRKLACAMLPL